MVIQAPGYQATTQDTPRVLKRGQLETFFFKFFYDQSETQPVVPVDPQTHPNFRILAPNGEILHQGIAVPAGSPGFWRVGWIVPKDAELTNVNKRYRFQTIIVDANFRQFETSFEFDVVETAVPAQKPELQQLLTFVGEGIRINFANSVRPDSLKVKVVPRGQDFSPLHVANWTFPVPVIPGPNDLKEIQRGNEYVYYTDVPIFPAVGEYTAMWNVRDFPESSPDMELQSIEVISSATFQLMKSLRMLIDKLQKKLGIVYAYTNEDIIEYLKRGIGNINAFTPPTFYNLSTIPAPLESLAIMASAVWGLTAQRILYAETSFEFCVDLDTLLPTRRGLIRARDLVVNRSKMLRRNLSTQLIYGNEEALFDIICSRFTEGTRLKEIISVLALNQCPVSLGGMFTRFRLNEFKSFNSLNQPVWRVSGFREHLEQNYGMFHETEEGCYEAVDELLTPTGFKVPECVWYLKNKQVYKLENELGYDLIATGNHPVLVLDSNTFEMSWKDLDKVTVGDLVALNTIPPEEDDDWEVSLEEHVKATKETNTSKTQSFFELPTKMTPELARLCGYLVSEGCLTGYDNVTFSNSNQKILDDFNRCAKSVLGKEATYCGVSQNGFEEYPSDVKVHVYQLYGVELRRFLFTLGMGYEKSKHKRIPDIILRSPKNIAKEFLKGFVEGDGCFTGSDLILSSSSYQLLSDLQQLLLRFGVISSKRNPKDQIVGHVSVRGSSLALYAEVVGFLFKGSDFQEKSKYYPQREALNPEILKGLIGIRHQLGVNSKGWATDELGNIKRYNLYWEHNAKLAKHITWEHVEDWFADKGDVVRELNPEIWSRLQTLLDTCFLWKKVTSLEKLDIRDVVDPSFKAEGGVLDHAFITNGIVTHNTGQTVTLGYNPGAELDGIIDRMNTAVNEQAAKTKGGIVRAGSSAGFISTRPQRFRSGLLYKIGSVSGTATNANVVQVLTSYGIPLD